MSIATPTKIKREVAPIPLKVAIWVTLSTKVGTVATSPKNIAPKNVRRLLTFSKYSLVAFPGQIPGILDPIFFKFWETSKGLKIKDE